jgi:hypothetical protein
MKADFRIQWRIAARETCLNDKTPEQIGVLSQTMRGWTTANQQKAFSL